MICQDRTIAVPATFPARHKHNLKYKNIKKKLQHQINENILFTYFLHANKRMTSEKQIIVML